MSVDNSVVDSSVTDWKLDAENKNNQGMIVKLNCFYIEPCRFMYARTREYYRVMTSIIYVYSHKT